MNVKNISVKPYTPRVRIIFDDTLDNIKKHVKRMYPLVEVGDNWNAFVMDSGDGHLDLYILTVNLMPLGISIIAHECFHITNRVMGFAGCKLTEESEEAYCYLHGSIMEQVLNILKKHNETIIRKQKEVAS